MGIDLDDLSPDSRKLMRVLIRKWVQHTDAGRRWGLGLTEDAMIDAIFELLEAGFVRAYGDVTDNGIENFRIEPIGE